MKQTFQIQTHLTYMGSAGLAKRGEHLTIEDQTETIATMLQRLQNGIPLPLRDMEYPEDENEEQYRSRDLTDIDSAVNELEDYRQKILAKSKIENSSEPSKDGEPSSTDGKEGGEK